MFTVVFASIIIVLVSIIVFNAISEEAAEKVKTWLIDTAKWMVACTITVAVFLAMFILLPPSHAEEQEFYQIVAIVSNIEDSDWDEADVLIEVDDLDNLWAYYEVVENIEFDADKEMEDMALRFIVDNGVLAETLREEPLTDGRIVVIQMWTCGTDNIEDDEILGVYYTEFIAL